jgi:hypothetical protein
VATASATHHDFPIGIGGLYIAMAEAIAANGYALPTTIPLYTRDGIPFAYPPLMFYVLAAIHDLTGLSFLTIERFAPMLLWPCCTGLVYLVAREFAPERDRVLAVFAAWVFAVSPTAYHLQLDAGGVVRGPALICLLIGLRYGLRLFREASTGSIGICAVMFGLTLLIHLGYATLYVISYLVFFLCTRPTWRKFGYGLIVGLVGLALASPYWLQVLVVHGIGPFLSAGATANGSLKQVLIQLVTMRKEAEPFLAIYMVLGLLGAMCLAARGKWLLLVWYVAIIIFYGTGDVFMLPLGIMAALFVLDVLLPTIMRTASDTRWARVSAGGIVGALALYGLGSGLAPIYHARLAPEWVPGLSASDQTAMTWAEQATPPDSHWLVVGDSAEWFPVLARRRILVASWGIEWQGMAEWALQTEMSDALAACGADSVQCLDAMIARHGLAVDYVYLTQNHHNASLIRSARADPGRWVLEYDNGGAVILRRFNGAAP